MLINVYTRPSKHETFNLCWVDTGPALQMNGNNNATLVQRFVFTGIIVVSICDLFDNRFFLYFGRGYVVCEKLFFLDLA